MLNHAGQEWLRQIDTHPVWISVPDLVRRQKLLHGYHEESFASLALHMQYSGEAAMEVDGASQIDVHYTWMRAVQPMEMIKLERNALKSQQSEVVDVCRNYRDSFILENIQDGLATLTSNRIIIMTNTLRHLEMACDSAYSVIRLFEIQTELELYGHLDAFVSLRAQTNAGEQQPQQQQQQQHLLFIQYDAMTEPIEQFQFAKYEVETRMRDAKCRVVFVIHVDPQPAKASNNNWVFSFGDGWEYCFIDEIASQQVDNRIPLKVFVGSSGHDDGRRAMASFVRDMSDEFFKSLLLEMLGPNMHNSLSNLRSGLGHFYSGVRGAVGLADNSDLVQLLKECLTAQLADNGMEWDVVEAVGDANFDSSSSLTESLWGVFKHKISSPLSHLLLVSDVYKVSDAASMALWCDFVRDNYADRLIFSSTEHLVQIPVGFRFCTQPFARLLSVLDKNLINGQPVEVNNNNPVHWLLNRIRNCQDGNDDGGGGGFSRIKEAYFRDWLLLRIPPHLHRSILGLPVENMSSIMNRLFEDPEYYFDEWERSEADVIAALELVSIATFTLVEDADQGIPWDVGKMRNWSIFAQSATHLALTELGQPGSLKNVDKFSQAVTSIEASEPLYNLVDRVDDIAHLWLGLRITKRVLLFDAGCNVKLPELQGITAEKLVKTLTTLVVDSVIKPRFSKGGRRILRQADLYSLLTNTGACTSPEELYQTVQQCPATECLVPLDQVVNENCPSCNAPLVVTLPGAADGGGGTVLHWKQPDRQQVDQLFQDHDRFLFFFERVAELFIQQRGKQSRDILTFLNHLITETRLVVSWRFMTVTNIP